MLLSKADKSSVFVNLLVLFNKKKINVIRIGLQNTNEITDPNLKESQVVAGPYHPAFRQLVESLDLYLYSR